MAKDTGGLGEAFRYDIGFSLAQATRIVFAGRNYSHNGEI